MLNFSLFFKFSILFFPMSKCFSLFWNFGSMLGLILVLQTFSGILLTFFYTNDASLSFLSVQHIMYESFFGWLLRVTHFNGASCFFFFVFLHLFKGLVMGSFRLKKVWLMGMIILILLMAEAFLGYVLVWAQMSFWASVVITSLVSVVPYFGFNILIWIWGGFNVGSATLKFFFTLHFLIPFFLMVLVLFHMIFLHLYGSTSKVFSQGWGEELEFYPYYFTKDGYDFIFFFFFMVFMLQYPFLLGDSEMFLESNSMMSPVHIVPEWYFLFAYAILRAIPNKVLGVMFLLLSLLFLVIFMFYTSDYFFFDVIQKLLSFTFIINGILLSWLGQCLVEFPFLMLSLFFTFVYFLLLTLIFFNSFFSFNLYV